MLRQSLLLLLAALALCLAACKREPDLPDDPHVPPVNPFIGVWKETETRYWQFKPDGTGGKASAQAGPFSDDFSFLFFDGKGPDNNVASKGLLILEGDPVVVTSYTFSTAPNQATLTPTTGNPITLTRISGSPQAVSLTNPLIGEWSADWSLPGDIHDSIRTWSLKYYADGAVKVYHHGLHQFENAYALRGNTLVMYGAYRYKYAPVVAEMHQLPNGKWHVQETQSMYGMAEWTYTKVAAAKWKK